MEHTKETKKKLSEMRQGENNPFYGKRHTPETREKLAQVLRTHRPNGTVFLSPRSIIIPPTIKLAYLAGIIDGEGSIRFIKRRESRYPFIAVYNSDKNLIDWLQRDIGGKVSIDKRGRTPGYAWIIQSARDVYQLIEAIEPYLIVKKEDAQKARDFLLEKYGEAIKEN